MEKYTALVVGAKGVIGSNLIRYLQTLDCWNIIGLSRKKSDEMEGVLSLSVDLLDKGDTLNKLAGLNTVTHVFYTAYQDRPTWAELVAPNMTMLQNVVETIEKASPMLQHISFMQGYKVYGAHLGPFKTPAREDDPPIMPPEFMTEQQMYMSQKQQGKNWTWSAIRPSVVSGYALGNPMNLAMVIAVYASICRELNLPFRFPGKSGRAYHHLMEMTDAALLAKATVWAATETRCANQVFNINNGDLFRWSELWPKIGKYFHLENADPLPLPLAEVMSSKETLWESMMAKYGLQYSYREVSSWLFGDFVFSWDYDFLADGSKARRLGFHEFVDTEQMFYAIFDEFKKNKVIPMID
ncbi:SDR family oxidoreductase [Olivibacter sitiensis]|uniref:SDR family oxidoreductase n=1 Tax=Olivibacter sitiensis TaxID=376470 RepID=UPI00040AB10A|nr:SDR family oxidoreductase [Olivibacter sitiensis]